MKLKTQETIPLGPDHAQLAVRDWLETQSRVTGYWRDLLVSSGGSEELIAVLDHHADVLAAAARRDYDEGRRPH